ncbi:DHHW family protein [Cohnella caldifontis]|uniref:DHHW family protein n=1 Tax=Cohnella caldifontis TaxID=3027471 RepID=UPI0023EB0889|nr:DHHW family protein [Cohnella sp. YIM B05605]
MTQNGYRWNVALFLLPVAALAVLNLVKPDGNAKVSELEKRELQAWPAFSVDKLVHGTLFKEYDDYFSDHFVFRNGFVELGSAAKELKGNKGSDGISLVVNKGGNNMGEALDDGGGSGGTDPEAVAAAGGTASDDGEGEVVSAESSTYLVVKDKAMLLYQYSPASAEAYAKAINHLRSLIDPKIRVYSMLVPSQVEFVESEKLRKLSGSQKEAFGHVYELLDSGVKGVPAYESVEAHKGEYVYFRSDHHWTALGAYYGYQALAKTMGFDPVPLDKYQEKDLPGFLGTAYAATLNAEVKKHPDTVATFPPFVKHTYTVYRDGVHGVKRTLVEGKIPADGRGGYAVFLGGDFALSRIATDVKNGQKLLVIKDSYANAVVPFLLPHFQEIEVLDPRYFKGSLPAEIQKRGFTDVLFLNGPVVTTYTGIAKLLEERMPTKA